MLKLLKLNILWLNKAKIVLVILAVMVNMPIHEAKNDTFMSVSSLLEPKPIKVVLTAYSSTPNQTDDTPFITASNTHVRDGIVAANFLAFGTKVQIPEIFGDKVFTVEDRMAKKHSDKIDIWFPERQLAKNFGIQEAEVIVLE